MSEHCIYLLSLFTNFTLKSEGNKKKIKNPSESWNAPQHTFSFLSNDETNTEESDMKKKERPEKQPADLTACLTRGIINVCFNLLSGSQTEIERRGHQRPRTRPAWLTGETREKISPSSDVIHWCIVGRVGREAMIFSWTGGNISCMATVVLVEGAVHRTLQNKTYFSPCHGEFWFYVARCLLFFF